ncbi:SusD-like starch-binding protein associating with outer membrane [Gillisia mitskevichiae]|uniref:SusD-like starch-binding protein associating with outer membrane n=1 Tax=Gillisia mitskevichiae TaxID=270921 RepID=A0A495PV49_9FLAO|nr:SusD/RagB family nutrient-binding outer membrane lipoprotein [Gillisia mitskevichiae]RKS53645.1 SusD-like starch-binding protein associating with outer membrane [Gillisia mitskevichiae]
MKTIKHIIFLLFISITLNACDDYLGDNLDPNKELLENLEPKDLLATSIVNTSNAYYNTSLGISQYSQQIASYFQPSADTQEETQLTAAWNLIYLQALPDLNDIISLANNDSNSAYVGIAKVLQATNLGLATDQWGDVPASQATMGEEDFTPSFDTQESVYNQINTLLDESIAIFDAASASSVGEEDLIYNGDLSKWKKAAYFLKARYAIHLTEVDQANAISQALANAANSFTSNADDFQLTYNTRNFNPWYAGVVLPNNTGNFSVLLSDQTVSLMDGTAIPFSSIDRDPRLPIITTIGENDTEYRGALNGTGGVHEFGATEEDDNISATTDFGADNFYSSQIAPIIMGSYAELKFIEAEALFLQNGGTATSVGSSTEAYAAYLEGIQANMDKLGVSGTESAAYLADASVAVGADNLTLALIMREKYIATFLNPESFVDLRRYDFSPEVFIGLELPYNHNEVLNGEWVRRAQYPSSEQTRNGEEVGKVLKPINVGVWWDRD